MISDSLSLHGVTIEVRSPQPHAALVVLRGEHDLYSADQLRGRGISYMSLSGCDLFIVDTPLQPPSSSTPRSSALLQTMKQASGLGRRFSIVVLGLPLSSNGLCRSVGCSRC